MGMREEGAVFATGIIENISLMVGVFPKKDPIEGLGVVPTPPLPDEEGDGAMPADLIPTPTGGQPGGAPMPGEGGEGGGEGAPGQPTPGQGQAAPDQVMPLGEQQPPIPQENGEAPPSDD